MTFPAVGTDRIHQDVDMMTLRLYYKLFPVVGNGDLNTFAADRGAPTFGRGFFFGVLFRAALTGRFCRSAAFPSYARDMIFCTGAGDMRPVGSGTLGVRARSQPSTFDGVVCTVKANDAIVRFEISMFPI